MAWLGIQKIIHSNNSFNNKYLSNLSMAVRKNQTLCHVRKCLRSLAKWGVSVHFNQKFVLTKSSGLHICCALSSDLPGLKDRSAPSSDQTLVRRWGAGLKTRQPHLPITTLAPSSDQVGR